MKNRIVGIFMVVIICICFFKDVVYAKEMPDELKNLYARSAVLMDADSGRILVGKNEDERMPMASTTKIMTCILALENMQENQMCTVSDYAARQPKVHLGIKSGEQFYMNDLLYSLMLESHNDSAIVIAEAIAGSVQEFALMMNKKAMELGCTGTYFITPNGLDAEDENGAHTTTSADLAMIMRYCILESEKKEEFLKITRTDTYQFTDASGRRNFFCSNHNVFLGMMEGALSGKTGFTNKAGYCYVGALRRGKRTFIVALLACGWPNNKSYKWKDTRKLMNYALDNYNYCNVWKDIKTNKIEVRNGFDAESPFMNKVLVETDIANNDYEVNVLMKADEYVQVKYLYKQNVKAPVQKNVKVGKIFYMINGEILKSYDIVVKKEVKKRTQEKCFLTVISRFFFLENVTLSDS